MRISDWSSDVCSSDLLRRQPVGLGKEDVDAEGAGLVAADLAPQVGQQVARPRPLTEPGEARLVDLDDRERRLRGIERQSVVQGKSVPVRVDIGGRRFHTKKIIIT